MTRFAVETARTNPYESLEDWVARTGNAIIPEKLARALDEMASEHDVVRVEIIGTGVPGIGSVEATWRGADYCISDDGGGENYWGSGWTIDTEHIEQEADREATWRH